MAFFSMLSHLRNWGHYPEQVPLQETVQLSHLSEVHHLSPLLFLVSSSGNSNALQFINSGSCGKYTKLLYLPLWMFATPFQTLHHQCLSHHINVVLLVHENILKYTCLKSGKKKVLLSIWLFRYSGVYFERGM